MINGAFGVGKTTVAEKLLDEVENSMLFDPEEIGFMLRNVIPEDRKGLAAETEDFRDIALWKDLTVDTAQRLVNNYSVNLIIPMTIEKPEYFNHIYKGFRTIDPDTYHFCLLAREETIYSRLRERGELIGTWPFQQTEKCVKAYRKYDFSEYINTENKSVSTIVEHIMEKVPNNHTVKKRPYREEIKGLCGI